MDILTDIYQFFFVSSITFMVYIVFGFILKVYGRFKLKQDTKFVLTKFEKIALWISVAFFFTYIF